MNTQISGDVPAGKSLRRGVNTAACSNIMGGHVKGDPEKGRKRRQIILFPDFFTGVIRKSRGLQ